MTPFEIVSHQDGISNDARARELYKYYQPMSDNNQDPCFPSSPTQVPTRISYAPPDTTTPMADTSDTPVVTADAGSSKLSSPNTALTAFCQLVAWRLGAQRAMISLIDSDTQYFIAESTKTLDLKDNTKHAVGDDLWMGCGSVSKAGKLCERTIAVKSTNGDYPSFVVTDLSKDERFNQLPFVTGSPFMRLYAGVPIITKRGIPIGSLFIVDSEIRPNGVSQDDINFMVTMAKTIMKQLEMLREVEEHRRGMKMSRGLASFVEGRSQLVEADLESEDGEGSRVVGQFETAIPLKRSTSNRSGKSIARSIASSVRRKEKENSAAMVKTEEAILTEEDIPDSRPSLEVESQPNSFAGSTILTSPPVDRLDSIVSPEETVSEVASMNLLFSRASNLIREAFEVDGGAVFYDAQRGINNLQQKPTSASANYDSHPASGDEVPSSAGEDPEENRTKQTAQSPGLGEGLFSRSSIESRRPVEILGFSTAQASSIHGNEYPGSLAFVPFDEKSLHTLLCRYPRGKLWTFNSDGAMSSSSEDISSTGKKETSQIKNKKLMRKKRTARTKSDAKFLAKHFPGVRQLLFVPLWDAGRIRWLSGCCVWSTEPTRVLSKASELSFLSAFGNSVMAECSRIDTEIADQKKGDFIGSISHELRSPLHGILASAEFLGEEELSSFEKGLVETIDSCGRTLLDTINHILDFSKINHFEKNWRKNKRSGNRPSPRSADGTVALRQSDLPMINLFADVDISTVCEEVVESVFAGHVFQNVTAQSFDMVPGTRGKMSSSKTSQKEESSDASHKHPDVVVILDIDAQNYHFTTQPGAFRRVIMNLLGNALKYTSRGFVKVTLEASEIDDLCAPGILEAVARSMITLTVADTGKGISGDFLRSKLFTPFAQENSLSSGTGLGLSIVRSIVNLLEGDITIDSEVGRGTEVRVMLPLLREMPKQPESANSVPTPRSASSLSRENDESIDKLRAQISGKKVALYGFDLKSVDPIAQRTATILNDSVTKFLTQWYGLRVVPYGHRVNLIVANEIDPVDITRLVGDGTLNKPPTVLVLCSHSTRFDKTVSVEGSAVNVGFVAKPVGPLKLARALIQCLDANGPALSTPGLLDPMSAASESNDLSKVFEELSLTPNSAEILDNSRMAAGSDNARKAIESPTPNAASEKTEEFPFPVPLDGPSPKKVQNLSGAEPEMMPPVVPILATPLPPSILPPSPEDQKLQPPARLVQTTSDTTPRPFQQPQLQPPRLLLVDDNKINLTLLRTFMRKRKYDLLDEAANGLEAVTKFDSYEGGYDIIFMDISMPILDGFGATRQIRAIEESRRRKANELAGVAKSGEKLGDKVEEVVNGTRMPALVIALTGLASSRDQNEAFASGVDLFLTKPVAFREVGKLLDNWEANRDRGARFTEANASEK
ncbi:histidine kinase-group I protein [Calycina marina]|uniref:histidine kinase n=1 Tax=Calycina marina TaxID=1763456 RepID=A0A9P8CF18_9HELO|nr:histidine kinase-group I protein [Calycina marina]